MEIIQKNNKIKNILEKSIKNGDNKDPKTDNDNSTNSVNDIYDVNNNKFVLKKKFNLDNNVITLENEITPEQFENLAQTGDLILLKTKYISAAFKRLFICDKYDHILFVYENSGIITFLDSSIDGICQGTDWTAFKNSLVPFNYEKITYRKLNIAEQDLQKRKIIENNIFNNLKKFVKEVSNKHYYISVLKILCKGKPKEFEIKGEWDKAFGFNCSSFIAALYSKLGFIKLEKTVHSFLPGDFEKDNKLNFLPGFSLEPPKVIVFERK